MKHRIISATLSLTVLLVSLTTSGCGQKKYDSPEAVFSAASKALEKEDMEKFLNCMTEESQDVFAGGIVMVTMMVKGMAEAFGGLGGEADKAKEKFAKLDEVMAKHGLTKEYLKGIEEVQPGTPEEAMKKLLEPVKDKPELVSDMMEAFKELDESGDGPDPAKAFSGELEDLKIDGDTATAKMVTTVDGKKEKEDIKFKLVDGGWLIHLELAEMGLFN